MDHSQFSDLTGKERKLQHLMATIAAGGKVLVAFSGGVDSSFLLLESVKTLGRDRVVAAMAVSPTLLPDQLREAQDFAEALDMRLVTIETPEFQYSDFVRNDSQRCYHCKLVRYRAIKALAEQYESANVFDGAQADDDPSLRPGFKALVELGIHTPLKEAGFGKDDIRAMLKSAGFHRTAAKPSQTCLATRIPTGTPLTEALLDRVRSGEDILRNLGFIEFRLRTHGRWARIVLNANEFEKIFSDVNIRKIIVQKLKKIGYETITIDLEEYCG